MKYQIIIANDLAGQNIKKFLDKLNVPYHEVDEKSIHCESIDKELDADVLIFATTHRSAKGVQSLTVHAPGNFGSNDLGGKEKTLNIVPASLIKELYLELKNQYEGEVTLEGVHHGPYLEKPACFIEIGSSEKEWTNPKLGEIIAKVLSSVLKKVKPYKSVLILGGGHYSQAGNKILERTNYAVGQICPKHSLKNLDEDMIKQIWEKNLEKPEFFALDWKGMGSEKTRIVELLNKLNLPYKKAKELWSK